MTVPAAATAAVRDEGAFSVGYQVGQDLAGFLVVERGAYGHLEHNRSGVFAGAVGAHAVLAALRFVTTRIAEIHQGVEIEVGQRKHVPAASTVTSVGATEFFVLFVAKRDAAVSAITCGNVDKGFVYKFHGVQFNKAR